MKHLILSFLIVGIAMSLSAQSVKSTAAQTKPQSQTAIQPKVKKVPKDTLKVLFIGNSYTYYNNLPHIVSILSDSTDTKLITKKSTLGGSWLHEHWNGKRNLKTREILTKEKFDIVVLQEYSLGSIQQPDSLRKYVRQFAQLVRKNGAEPMLFLVWAREKVPQYQAELDDPHQFVAKENNMKLIPVGKAWEMARTYRPTAPLFDLDGTHPADLGTFLSAAVIVGAITGQVPKTVPATPTLRDAQGETIELMRLDWLDMIFALKVANEAVEKYCGE
jgi:hypothetical protein